ncbi:oligosaccharyl transferase alpha subunit [Fomitiporia mediterranea MF3/22]|uniref:oligosaccharyl transferase alpha subunit n=1 Tax=Fomitiporia mediterranea (strain MF3/22) TaxID=694068 RepID=UPI00044082A9|nr:oligosaccharyl transferase alpha subunit [Fomitiporia mediterranea MF3/22]EJD01498.1 oligosaccharyl transferase alpha subunit [Fomitiporia mediterranea MF3/22]
MAIYRHLFLLVSLICSVFTYVVADHSFENTAIVRTVELAGSLVHVKTTFAAKALETGAMIYAFALGREDGERTSFMEARLKGEQEPLELQRFGLNAKSNTYLYAAVLPNGLKKDEAITVELETVQTHATYPWPPEVGQNAEMSLKYETDLFILSPYATSVQRTKIRASSPRINSYTEPKGLDAFTFEAPVTKSGATITYGPYNNIPASANADFIGSTQQRITVHYKHNEPALEITKMKRAAEVSHWGANINIQDDIWLHNAGPKLKGHFSRLDHQRQAYTNQPAGHIMRAVNLYLPSGVHDVYFIDTVGNVSTSRLREAPSVPKGARSKQSSWLELRPRYPLMGGWNYSFTLGFDAPLQDWEAYDSRDGRHLVAVPMQTLFPDTVVDEAEIKVILPEGAIDIEVYPPFPPLSVKKSMHKSYLDSKGRPTVSFFYKNLTDRHVGFIYVGYKVPFTEHLRKPVTIAVVFFGLFIVSSAVRRVDMNIRRNGGKQ